MCVLTQLPGVLVTRKFENHCLKGVSHDLILFIYRIIQMVEENGLGYIRVRISGFLSFLTCLRSHDEKSKDTSFHVLG